MLEWIGIACVVWTATELLRMSAAAAGARPDAVRYTPDAQDARDARDAHDARPVQDATGGLTDRAAAAPRRRVRRFAAWDDRGRPIEVEDLGHTHSTP